MSDELKPCPECGAHRRYFTIYYGEFRPKIECHGCGHTLLGEYGEDGNSINELRSAWNTRKEST